MFPERAVLIIQDANIHTHTEPFYGSMDFVRVNPGEPVPEETFTHYSRCQISLLYNIR